MRYCPRCGYKESPIWRNNPHRLYTQYCRLDELEDWEPEIAKVVKEKKTVKIMGYIYHLNKKNNIVSRIHESDSVDGTSWLEPRTEKALMKRIMIEGQTKLIVK